MEKEKEEEEACHLPILSKEEASGSSALSLFSQAESPPNPAGPADSAGSADSADSAGSADSADAAGAAQVERARAAMRAFADLVYPAVAVIVCAVSLGRAEPVVTAVTDAVVIIVWIAGVAGPVAVEITLAGVEHPATIVLRTVGVLGVLQRRRTRRCERRARSPAGGLGRAPPAP